MVSVEESIKIGIVMERVVDSTVVDITGADVVDSIGPVVTVDIKVSDK
jgi:hypothetical protein